MKVKENYVMRQMADEYIAVPVGEGSHERRAIVLNEVGAFLWGKLTEDTTREALLEQMLAEYEVEETVASADLDAFLASMRSAGMLE